MAGVTTKSLLMGKLGNSFVQAHNQVKDAPVKQPQGGECPAGVENGDARLVECKIVEIAPGKTNAGKLMFYAAAIVKRPKEIDGMNIEGLRTQINEPLFDTPTRSEGNRTLTEHIAKMYNHLKLLGLKVENLRPDTIEVAIENLKKTKPMIKFRTWKGQKQTTGMYAGREPMINHMWLGLSDYKEPENAVHPSAAATTEVSIPDDVIQAHIGDNNIVEPGTTTAQGEALFSGNPVSTNGTGGTTSNETAIDLDNLDSGDIDSLAKRADAQDLTAMMELQSMALKAGVTQEFIDNASSWVLVVAEMKAKTSNDLVIEVGGHYLYNWTNPTTKAVEPLTVEIMELPNDNTEVAHIRGVANKMLKFRNIKLTELNPVK